MVPLLGGNISSTRSLVGMRCHRGCLSTSGQGGIFENVLGFILEILEMGS